MALRVELIGLYCLISAVSSDCAVFEISNNIRNGAIDSTKIDCSCLLVSGRGKSLPGWSSKGYRSTINNRIRTGTDSGNPTV